MFCRFNGLPYPNLVYQIDNGLDQGVDSLYNVQLNMSVNKGIVLRH
jgi:hypothetical protein